METIYGEMFVIPNHMRVFDSSNPCNRSAMRGHNANVSYLGLGDEYRLEEGDTGIEIWVCGAGSDNWSDHYLPETIGNGRFITYIPTHILMSLDEGDQLELDINNHHVVLTASQLNHRYRDFGTFGQALRLAVGV